MATLNITPINMTTIVVIFFCTFLIGRFLAKELGVIGYFVLLVGVTLTTLEWVLWRYWYLLYSGVGLSDWVSIVHVLPWLKIKSFEITWSFEFTIFTTVMVFMILIVFLSVLCFSFYYLKFEPKLTQFLSYLSLFVAFMLVLVTAGNFVVFFLGWEGVGLSSFLLINFWTTRIQTNKSALKALLVNRIGDFFLLVGVALVYKLTRSFEFQVVFASAEYLANFYIPELNLPYIDIIGIAFLTAAMSKSAQAGLHTWLPDAMEGPTPVSAMIHAATMVTAGLYLLLRCSALIVLSPLTMQLIFIIGVVTVLLASLVSAWQYDIKKIIAFSTCSQLGYMMTIIGSSYFSLGFFHLLTHAFFKALLFLAAGGVIHAMQGEQDLRRLSGSFSNYSSGRVTFSFLQVAFLIGTFSIVGVIFFSGFYSKELILFALQTPLATNTGWFSTIILNFSVFLTSYYSFRLLVLLFFSQRRSTTIYYHYHRNYQLDWWAVASLSILMFFSVAAGIILKSFVLTSYIFANVLFFVSSPVTTVEFVGISTKLLPVFLIAFGFVCSLYQSNIAVMQQTFSKFSYFLQSKYFYDGLLNKVAFAGLKIAKKIYLSVDKGVLEWVGPYGLFLFFRPISISLDLTLFDRRIEASYLGFTIGIIFFVFLGLLDFVSVQSLLCTLIFSF